MDRPVAAQEVPKEGLRALIVDHVSIVFTPVPMVILTSSREEKDLVEGYKIGVNAYVVARQLPRVCRRSQSSRELLGGNKPAVTG